MVVQALRVALLAALSVLHGDAVTPAVGSARTLPGRDFEIDIPCSFGEDAAVELIVTRFYAAHFLAATIRKHVGEEWKTRCTQWDAAATAAASPVMGMRLKLDAGAVEVTFSPLRRHGNLPLTALLPETRPEATNAAEMDYTNAVDFLASEWQLDSIDRASLERLLSRNAEFARRRRFEKMLPLAGAAPLTLMRYPSQYGQDEWVMEEVYPLKREGFFVDVGAVDGLLLSNSLALERVLGWRGVCVEPSSAHATLVRERSCSAFRACLSDVAGEEVEFVEDSGDGSVLGMASMLSGMVETLGAHRDRVVNGKVTVMRTRTLRSVLDEANAPLFIEFLSLDTEGSELRILRGAGLEKYTFGAIVVEHNDEKEKRAGIHALLCSHGYVRVRSAGADDFYRSEGSWR